MHNDYKKLGADECAFGLKPRNGMPEAYYIGYSEQYEKEQQLSQGNN